MATLLEIENLNKRFSGVQAIFDLTHDFQTGSITAVIGPNGAGKTTLINMISGHLRPSNGDIRFQGKSLRGQKAHRIARSGIARTFQTVELFGQMTVLENVMVGRYSRSRSGIIQAAFRFPACLREETTVRERALSILNMVGLVERAELQAANLPLGEQKLLEVARAVAAEPRLLLLDEPAAGLNEAETQKAARMIKNLIQEGMTIILVEHDMKMVMSISDEILVLNYGSKVAAGPPSVVRADPEVIKAYLGDENSGA